MIFFGQLGLTGLMVGGLYGLVAVSFVLIYKSTRVFNFAQGEMVMLGAYFCWAMLVQLHLPLWAGLPLTLLLAMGMGLVIERLCLRPMIGQPILSAVMMTIALSSVLAGVTLMIWGHFPKVLPPLIPTEAVHLGQIILSQQTMFCFLIALIAFGIFALFFKHTRLGLAMRTTAEDHQIARSLGVSVTLVFGMAWGLSAMLSGMGGILLGTIAGANTGLAAIGLKAIPAVLVGGVESIGGALIGGLIIGVTESLAAGYLDPLVGGGTKEIFPYIVMMLILMVRPYGLFGLKRIERI